MADYGLSLVKDSSKSSNNSSSSSNTINNNNFINNINNTNDGLLQSLAREKQILQHTLSPDAARDAWDQRRRALQHFLLSDAATTPQFRSNNYPGQNGRQSAAMARSASSTAAIPSTSKRDHRQIDVALSTSYTYGAVPSWTPSTSSTTPATTTFTAIKAYSPGAYVSHLAAPTFSATKRQKVGAVVGCGSSTVSPSTSISSRPSYSSLLTSEDMSRQSSASTSMTDSSDMMRLESSFSNCPDLPFPFDPDVDASFASAVSSQATTLAGESSAIMLGNVDCGFVAQDFSFSDPFPSAGRVDYASLLAAQAPPMQRSGSEHSTSSSDSSSSHDKASERRRKHIENAKHNPIRPRDMTTPATISNPRPLRPQDPDDQRKEIISKTPYVRPHHPKLYCEHCQEHPIGFRGEHELRRHMDRAHAELRKVWICVEPTKASEEGWLPAKPLNICKQCKQQKRYNVYYNAAAHLRRAHFCPRKRGRKARGEERESRAGKAGGDWPPIDWLKTNGWLRQIEVLSSAEDPPTTGAGTDQLDAWNDDILDDGDMGSYDDDFFDASALEVDDATFLTDLQTSYHLTTPSTDGFYTGFDCGYPTPIELSYNACFPPVTAPHQAPLMEHTVSAPPTFSSYNSHPMGLHFDPRLA